MMSPALLFRAAGRPYAEGPEETFDGEAFLQCPRDLPLVLGDDRKYVRFGHGRVRIRHRVSELVMADPALALCVPGVRLLAVTERIFPKVQCEHGHSIH